MPFKNKDMLTRLKVKGFKTLSEIDLHFGPFTCIAGANAAGKSNLFDAILFISALADNDLITAASMVRDGRQGQKSHLRHLFHFDGKEYSDTISFEAEMIVPKEGIDGLGQIAHATNTFLKYHITLRYRKTKIDEPLPSLEIVKEELSYIKKGEALSNLPFKHSKEWRGSVVDGKRWTPFISTDENGTTAHRHQDDKGGKGGKGGIVKKYDLKKLTRTLLSICNSEHPTACQARNEMRSWRLMQLEPSSLRCSDEFNAPANLNKKGGHLAATLHRLAKQDSGQRVYAEVANQLAELMEGVRDIRVDKDEKRELMTLEMQDSSGCWHPSRSLSDGTLRFLALSILGLDNEAKGVWCLEEPENGIHPQKIEAIIQLLMNIAMDTDLPIEKDNPLRQVITNTHSPIVVAEVPNDSLVMMKAMERTSHQSENGYAIDRYIRVSGMSNSWRTDKGNEFKMQETTTLSRLISYLSPITKSKPPQTEEEHQKVKDNPDIQPFFNKNYN